MVLAATAKPSQICLSPEATRSAKFWIIGTCCGVSEGVSTKVKSLGVIKPRRLTKACANRKGPAFTGPYFTNRIIVFRLASHLIRRIVLTSTKYSQ